MKALAAFALSLGMANLSPGSGKAQDGPKPLVLALTVSSIPSDAALHAHVTDDGGFDVVSGDGSKETLQIPDPDPQKPAKLSYVLELQSGGRGLKKLQEPRV